MVLTCGLTGCSPPSPSTHASAEPAAAAASGKIAVASDQASNTADLDHPSLRAPDAVPGELLVKMRSKADVGVVLGKSGARSAQAFKTVPGLTRVRVGAGVSTHALLERLRADPNVEYAEPNYIVRKNAVPNDPRYVEQWNLHNTGQTGGVTDYDINAPEGWDLQTSAAGVVVAIIDTGIDYTHEDLEANIYSNPGECTANGIDDDDNGYVDDCHGIDTANGDSDPMDDEGHGTHVAGILGAVGNNGVGTAGVAWSVQMLPCKFLTQSGEGTTAGAIACLDYVAALKDSGVNIVATNNSWGGYEFSQALSDAVAVQRTKGIVFVAAAGNDGVDLDRLPEYPCALNLDNVVCVASFPQTGAWEPSSNNGKFTVHIHAPGTPVLSTLPGNQYGVAGGTSMAAPHVTGALALMAAQNPARDWRATRNLLISSGYYESLYGTAINSITWRRLRLDQALNCTNQVVKSRIAPRYEVRNPHRVGVAIDVSALHLNCGAPNGALTATVTPGGETLDLLDNGTGADVLAGDGIYSARWTPGTPAEYTVTVTGAQAEQFFVTADAQIKAGYPVKQVQLGGTYSLPVYLTVGNVAGDPRPEIITTSTGQGPVYVWNGDGTPATGWPILDDQGAIVLRGVGYTSLAELDGDSARNELAVAYWYGDVFAYGDDASVLPGWPTRTVSTQEVADPTVAGDIDADGRDEIFVYDLGRVLAYRHDGTRLPGWAPIESGIPNIADLDGDGIPEFITATVPLQNIPTVVQALHSDGTSLAGFPVDLGANVGGNTLVGDVDGNGRNEVLVVSQSGAVRKVSDTGALSLLIPLPTEALLGVTGALADLDDDGIPEIITYGYSTISGTVSTYLYAYEGDGTLRAGFPVISTGYRTNGDFTPVIGDVDGDQAPDIVFGAQYAAMPNSEIYAVSRTGAMLPGFPKQLLAGSGSVPAIADLDLNGRNDIIISGGDLTSARSDSLWVYEYSGSGTHGPIEWGQLQGDSRHRGYYELGKNLPNHAFLSARVRGGGRVTATGIDCGADCVERYSKGASVTLTAAPDSGRTFAEWSGGCAGQGNPCTLTMNAYTPVLARFETGVTTHTLTVTQQGPGSVTSNPAGIACPGDCSQAYNPGAVVTLTATPGTNARFSSWTGACTGTSPTCTVAMTEQRQVTAGFIDTLPVTVTIAGSGTVTSTPGGIDCGDDCTERYLPGTALQLHATAAAGSRFTGWSGACAHTNADCAFDVTAGITATATFVQRFTLTVTTTAGGSVSANIAGISCGADCTEDFDSGASVGLTATAAAGNTFSGWSGACSGTGACTVTMSQARTVSAAFTANPPTPPPAGGGGGGGGRTDLLTLAVAALLLGTRLRRRPRVTITGPGVPG